ncbi:NADH-quinone oxidoreductase subunit C [Trinickia dinghuensis]|nr:NADH-quinone oxidoreductase subunit C [Trinickia dinghuensis]
MSVREVDGAITRLLASGGRLQMAYAWFRDPDAAQLRYIASTPGRREFTGWQLDVGIDAIPSLAGQCPLAGWYEREIMEMSGIAFSGHPEPERLVTAHLPPAGRGPLEPPDATRPGVAGTLAAPRLPQVSGKHVQLLPFGPVRADVLESAQFIFYYVGEGILHYHPNLFFKHRGMEKQFEGASCDEGALLAERVSGIDTVAHALAYAHAVEDATDCDVPPRARWLRVIAAELERIYNHLHYLGHLCHTTTLKVGEAQGKLLEERAKQIAAQACGSRLLRNVVKPGGVRRDLDLFVIAKGLDALKPDLERYAELLEQTPSHLDRLLSTGLLSRTLAFDQGATGPVERASGIDRDLRRDHPYAAYDALRPSVAVEPGGDAHARMKVRIAELRVSMALIDDALGSKAPDGPLSVRCVGNAHADGLGWAESSRGTAMYALHLDGRSRIARAKIKEPSFSNWRVFPFTVHDSNMMDYAINEASFGLTISGCAR